MTWSCGIVGLPNAGKSSLFKALTTHNVTIESYPFSTIDSNKAIVSLPDQRLTELAKLSNAEKMTPSTIEIVDVAGLVEGASKGEGLGNRFLGQLRNVDLLIHVVAGYDLKIGGFQQVASRVEIINLELILADLESLSRRIEKLEPKLKSGDKTLQDEMRLVTQVAERLERGASLGESGLNPAQRCFLDQLSLLTLKEMIYVYNLDESQLDDPDLTSFPESGLVVPLCARLEAELVDLAVEERISFLEVYGVSELRSQILLLECYRLLRLITFYTIKGTETRAWVAPAGIKALEAAGKVHSDMQRGFINVEVVAWDALLQAGSLVRAREEGLARTEGRDYLVSDGDVLLFRFR